MTKKYPGGGYNADITLPLILHINASLAENARGIAA